LRLTPFGKISLETILLHVMQSHFRLPIEQLVRRLSELEQLISENSEAQPAAAVHAARPVGSVFAGTGKTPPASPASLAATEAVATTISSPAPIQPAASKPPAAAATAASPQAFVSTDPKPSPADLGRSVQTQKRATSLAPKPSPAQVSPAPLPSSDTLKRPQHVYDTLFHFAAVELEGKLQKN